MNIFVLDKNQKLCSQYHCDKHVIKMILESAQILCTICNNYQQTPYKSTHKKHPCTLWAGKSLENWLWLKELVYELNLEYKYRFSKDVSHKSATIVQKLKTPPLQSLGLTPFAQAMPEKYKKPHNVVAAYRQYYLCEKKHLLKYTKRSKPLWVIDSNSHKS